MGGSWTIGGMLDMLSLSVKSVNVSKLDCVKDPSGFLSAEREALLNFS